jgi:glyoxylase-like metal-dependent hydrolase (beta-lactamase superfamily II)
MIFSELRGDGGSKLLTMTASERGLLSNSHLILGPEECLLVDAQLLLSEAEQVADRIQAEGRRLTCVYITHGHPDHYFGSGVFRRRFPGVRVLALPTVIDDIAASFEAKRSFWLATYGDDLPTTVPLLEPFEERFLRVDGLTLEVTAVGPAESPHDTVCYVEPLRAMLAGDLVYNGEHGWLGEHRADEWLEKLLWLADHFRDAAHVLPGHGARGGTELFETTAKYIGVFQDAVREGGGLNAARNRVLERYPNHALRLFLDISLSKWFPVEP